MPPTRVSRSRAVESGYVVLCPSGANDELELIGRLAADLGELTAPISHDEEFAGAGAFLPFGGAGTAELPPVALEVGEALEIARSQGQSRTWQELGDSAVEESLAHELLPLVAGGHSSTAAVSATIAVRALSASTTARCKPSALVGQNELIGVREGCWLIVAPLRSNDETSEQAHTGER